MFKYNDYVIVDKGEKTEVKGNIVTCFFGFDGHMKYVVALKYEDQGYLHNHKGEKLGYVSNIVVDAGNVEYAVGSNKD